MKTYLKPILLASAGLLTALLFTFVFLTREQHRTDPANLSSGTGRQSREMQVVPENQAKELPSQRTSAELEAMFRKALAEKNPERRRELLHEWALAMPLSAAEKIMDRIESIQSPQLASEVGQALVSRWAEENPMSAAAMLRQLAKPLPGSLDVGAGWIALFQRVGTQWARVDVKGAVNWVQSMPEGPAKAQVIEQVVSQWLETDPKAAATYAALRNDTQLHTNVALKWAEKDPQAATAWVRSLPADKAGAESGVEPLLAGIWAKKDPAAAAAYAASLPPGNPQNQAALAVASTWAATNPAQAAGWLAQFPDSPVRAQAMEQLMRTWAGSNTDQAAQWLQSLPQTHSRDFAVSAFSGAISSASPGTAFQWAGNISDEAMRNQQLQNVARVWLAQDPAAAKQKITQSNLPLDIKNQLLAGANR